MKVGAENKKKTIAAIALLVIAVVLVIRTLSAPSQQAAATPATVTPTRAAAKARGQGDRRHYPTAPLTTSLDPRLRLDLLKGSETIKYDGTGRNIFQEHMEEPPRPVAHGLKDAAKEPWRPQPPPPPPPINLKFYGWASQPGEPKAIFLSQDGDIFVAHEGDIVARRYKVVRISPNSVEIEDVLSNNRQSIPLTQG